jgi:hypothetical protein
MNCRVGAQRVTASASGVAGARIARASQAVAGFVESLDAAMWRRLAVCVALVQLAGVVVAVVDHVMLEADGSQFVYAIAVGRPWLLVWQDISVRPVAYALTVAPTAWIARATHLTPMAITALYACIYYGTQLALFVAGCALVWRRRPQLLVFPVATYAFAGVLEYGYPSEIVFAVGFLWICLFLVERGRAMSLAALVCFIGLVFSHEFAAPSALIVAAAAMAREHGKAQGAWRVAAIAVVGVLSLGFVAAAHVMGGASGEVPLTAAVPVALMAQDLAVWLVAIAAMVAGGIALAAPWFFARKGAWWLTVVFWPALPLVLLNVPGVNFQHALYPAGRTLLAIDMTAFAALFAIARFGDRSVAPRPQPVAARIAGPAVLASLACGAGAALAFASDFNTGLLGVERVAAHTPGRAPFALSLDDAFALMTPPEAAAARRLQLTWVSAYRSAILADGAAPTHLVYVAYNAANYLTYCRRSAAIDPTRSAIPPVALAEVRAYACAD